MKANDLSSVKELKALNYMLGCIVARVLQKNNDNVIISNVYVIEEGFYIDFDCNINFKEEDLAKLNQQVLIFLKTKFVFLQEQKTLIELLKLNKNNIFMTQQLQKMQNSKVDTILLDGNYFIKQYEILKQFPENVSVSINAVSGAYFQGQIENKQLQRIYGIAHFSQEQLQEWIQQINQRKEYDHRKIGQDLEIFMFDSLTGLGLPIWLPNGMRIKKQLQEYLRMQEFRYDYLEVSTPVMASVDLYHTSGHWQHYQQNMFPVMEMKTNTLKNKEALVLRPMSCPQHCLIYKNKLRSYRDLPLRFSEHELLFRYEASGALTGLERVRSMELTDSHIFCRIDQIKTEFIRTFNLITEVLKTLNININYYSLSLRTPNDTKNFYDNDKMWNEAEAILKQTLIELKLPYKEMIGEAAFYGPKLDIQIKTMLGHDVTVSTIQLDFLLPEKFNLEYKDADNQSQVPIIIHRGLIGTYERFIAILLEQTKGILPFWLAPQQVALIAVRKEHELYCELLKEKLKTENIKVFFDTKNERLAAKIRYAQTKKIPLQVVIGDDEIKNQTVTYREYGSKKQVTLSQLEFIKLCQKLMQVKLNNKIF